MSFVEAMSRKKTKQLGVLIAGESGLGKSTFVNNLCNRDVFQETNIIDFENAHLDPGLEIFSRQVQINDKNRHPVDLQLVLVNGLGDNIDNSELPGTVASYLDKQFDVVFSEENITSKLSRSIDTRPHVCLYFISPTSRGLRELDIISMKALCEKVNLIPIIAKSDLLTQEELYLNKKLIMQCLEDNKVQIYDFAEDTLKSIEKNDNLQVILEASHAASTKKISKALPFAVIASNDLQVDETGNTYHVRTYPWGTVKVEDPNVSDFTLLREVLLSSHLEKFKTRTHEVLYKNYKIGKLLKCKTPKGSSFSIASTYSFQRDSLLCESTTPLYTSGSHSLSVLDNPRNSKGDDKSLSDKDDLIFAYEQKILRLQKLLKSSSATLPSP
ncbi:hypothetical protein ACO0RG_002660 [Hanseniaspora osmophila]